MSIYFFGSSSVPMNLDVINEMTKHVSSVRDKQAFLKAFFPSSTNPVESMSNLGYSGDMNKLKNKAATKIQKAFKKKYHFLVEAHLINEDGRHLRGNLINAYEPRFIINPYRAKVRFLTMQQPFEMKHVKDNIYEITTTTSGSTLFQEDFEKWEQEFPDTLQNNVWVQIKIIWPSLRRNGKLLKYRYSFVVLMYEEGKTPKAILNSQRKWLTLHTKRRSFAALIEMPTIRHIKDYKFEITFVSRTPWLPFMLEQLLQDSKAQGKVLSYVEYDRNGKGIEYDRFGYEISKENTSIPKDTNSDSDLEM